MKQTKEQKMVSEMVEPLLYKHDGRTMINFEGTRSDYITPLVFLGVTASGNVKVGHIYLRSPEGIKYNKRLAKLRKSDDRNYLWIEDGTGSLVANLNGCKN